LPVTDRPLPPADLPEQVRRAIAEDVGSGDVTAALVPESKSATATVITREAAVICGQPWFDAVFAQLGGGVHVQWEVDEGARVKPNDVLCRLTGPARTVLTGERSALNFLQLLSGTATATRQYVDAVAGTSCRILDTRKTLPGLRTAQKYATRIGGAQNHRMGLYDAVLIKENHIAAAGSIAGAIARARATTSVWVEIEVENLAELGEALAAKPDVVMLDEFSLQDMRAAVALNRAQGAAAKLEASGGVSLDAIRDIAQTGVDCVSVGSITKHVRAIDLSMRFAAR
jgi:nicotinate-nucleotide pyrophosphorylase (carboxylating)